MRGTQAQNQRSKRRGKRDKRGGGDEPEAHDVRPPERSPVVGRTALAEPAPAYGRRLALVGVLGRRRGERDGPAQRAIVIIAAMLSAAALWYGGFVEPILGKAVTVGRAQLMAGGFTPQIVEVRGAALADAEEVRVRLGVDPDVFILDFDLDAARARVEQTAWVRQAMVLRLLPNRVVVMIEEREPLALWRDGATGLFHVVDTQGELVAGADPAAYARLPLVVGEGAPLAAPELLAVLAERTGVAREVAAAERIGSRRWDLHLRSGAVVKLPEARSHEMVRALDQLNAGRGVLNWPLTGLDMRHGVVLSARMADRGI